MVYLAFQVHRVLKVNKVSKVYKEILDRKEQLVLKKNEAFRVKTVYLAFQVHRVLKVNKVYRVKLARKDL